MTVSKRTDGINRYSRARLYVEEIKNEVDFSSHDVISNEKRNLGFCQHRQNPDSALRGMATKMARMNKTDGKKNLNS
jgi:hypothetical protein